MTTHQFEENREILGKICEDYGLKYIVGYYFVTVRFAPGCYMHFSEDSLSNPDWDGIKERICLLSLEDNF